MDAIIIDDETPARNNLKQIIKDNFKGVNVIGEAESVKTGVELLNKCKTDIVLLDINLSDGSGFNILEQLKDINFQVIFVTAYNEYAIKAFKFNALDYVLKPIEIRQLKRVFDKARELLNDDFITKEELNVVLDNYSKKDEDKKLVIHEMNKVTFVAINEIIKFISDGSYTTIYLNDNSQLTCSNTIKVYQELLPESMFYRVHNSSLINMNYVKEFNKEDGGYVVMSDGSHVQISRRRKNEFFKILTEKFL
jgi:two-component system, LytTR family, response regulator